MKFAGRRNDEKSRITVNVYDRRYLFTADFLCYDIQDRGAGGGL